MGSGITQLGQFLWHITPALVIVLGGGFLVNRFFVRKANLGLLVDRIATQLEVLSSDCAEYWCSDQSELGEKAVILEKAQGEDSASSLIAARGRKEVCHNP